MTEDSIAIINADEHLAHSLANSLRRLGVFTQVFPVQVTVERLQQFKGVLFANPQGEKWDLHERLSVPFADVATAETEFLEEFVRNCQCAKNWNMRSYLPIISERIKQQVGDRSVFLLVSGGVDSTVAFILLNRVLGADRVLGLHIDNGLMRLNESQSVQNYLQAQGINNLKVVDASEDFLQKLSGKTAPEEKRRIIGAEFLLVKDRELAKLSLDPQKWMIAQGTIYPDVVESGEFNRDELVKTHHNRVAEVYDLMDQGLLLEPLADLYKDEVRLLGEELGIPHHLVWRHPFPGPGLGVRLLCSNGSFDGSTDLQQIPQLGEYVAQNHLEVQLLPLHSVGVSDEKRTYAQPLLINSALTWEQYEHFAADLVKKFTGINRIVKLVGAVSDGAFVIKEQYLARPNLDILRKIDAVCTEFLQKEELYEKIWQMPVVLLPLTLEGKPVVVLRPVDSSDAMTAQFSKIPLNLLNQLWENLRNAGVGAAFYDITHKPPGTIEWE